MFRFRKPHDGRGITPRGSDITTEIDRNRKAGPKNPVPFKKVLAQRALYPPSTSPLRWGGAHRRKGVKITLAKRAEI